MATPSDHYRRENEARRKAEAAALVERRKTAWKDAGLMDDIARQRVVETDPRIWKGTPWWVQRRSVRWLANALIGFAVLGIFRAASQGAAFDLAFWIPLGVFAFQLRWHIARHGG